MSEVNGESELLARLYGLERRLTARLTGARNRFLFHDAPRGQLVVLIDGLIIRFPDDEVANAFSYALNDEFDQGPHGVSAMGWRITTRS
jgi:hypothetical protein